MKKMKTRALACALCAATLCAGTPAFAAGPAAVTLDGAPLTFAENAQPVQKNNRTYVPFRAIFEAMGATVAWDQETKTVSAARGGTAVSFVVGQKSVTVTEAGEQRTASTDAASFLQEGTTYVPVRFAAQALGANVGWDEARQTVILVDTARLGAEYADGYTIMDSLLHFAVPESSRAKSGELSLTYTVHGKSGDFVIPVTLRLNATEDRQSAYFTVRASADISQMAALLSAEPDAVPESVANLLTLLRDASFEGVLSRPDSALYLKGASLTEFGVPEGYWVRVPLDNALRALSGNAFGEAALTGVLRGDFAACAAGLAGVLPLSDASADNLGAVRAVLSSAQSAFGDAAFTSKSAGELALAQSGSDAGQDWERTLTLTMDANGAVAGAALTYALSGAGSDDLLSLHGTLDAAGNLTASGEAHSAGYSAALTLNMTSAPSESTPLRRPGANVLPAN